LAKGDEAKVFQRLQRGGLDGFRAIGRRAKVSVGRARRLRAVKGARWLLARGSGSVAVGGCARPAGALLFLGRARLVVAGVCVGGHACGRVRLDRAQRRRGP
jgi:hypothetical protein